MKQLLLISCLLPCLAMAAEHGGTAAPEKQQEHGGKAAAEKPAAEHAEHGGKAAPEKEAHEHGGAPAAEKPNH